MEYGGIEFGLPGPQAIEFRFDHGTVNVEVVALLDSGLALFSHRPARIEPGTQLFVLLIAAMQPFAYRAKTSSHQVAAYVGDGALHYTAVIFPLIGLAVAFESPPLIEMKQ